MLLVVASAFFCIMALADETPTMGWSSWNTYRVHISDTIICRQADAMVSSGLRDAGYRYVNIDDGFFGGRNADGRLLIHPKRFPHGLEPVVRHIHSLGLKAGIYSDAGRNTCGNYWDKDSASVGVGLYGHDLEDARFYFDEMGFDFIKIDFCGGDSTQNSERLGLDEKERYTAIRQAIDAIGRKDVRINVCRWAFPGTWVYSIGSSWRISPDIAPRWSSIKSIIHANKYLSAYAEPGHFNDMDMLEIGRGLSEAEERTHFGMWCIMSSPLLIGCDLTAIPDKSLRLLSNPELIALNQDHLGLQAYVVSTTTEGVTLWAKDVLTHHGLTRAVAVCNESDTAQDFMLHPTDVELGGRTKVRDLFARQDLAAIEPCDSMVLHLDPHDTSILLLEGTTRSEREVYEAETAWLERYQRLGINPLLGYAEYSDAPNCSGGGKVTHLGHHPDNWMEWRNVWSRNGGDYTLTIDYLQWESRDIMLTVNGNKPVAMNLPAPHPHSNLPHSATLTVHLRPGINRIRISNPTSWTPDIDRIVVRRAE